MVLEVLWNPRGDYGFNRCLERTRTTTTPPTKTNTLHYGTDQKNSLFCCVCFSSRLFYHFLSFVYFLLWKGRERFLKLALFLLSVLVKGEPFWILSVLVRGRNFNKSLWRICSKTSRILICYEHQKFCLGRCEFPEPWVLFAPYCTTYEECSPLWYSFIGGATWAQFGTLMGAIRLLFVGLLRLFLPPFGGFLVWARPLFVSLLAVLIIYGVIVFVIIRL